VIKSVSKIVFMMFNHHNSILMNQWANLTAYRIKIHNPNNPNKIQSNKKTVKTKEKQKKLQIF
jgi:hypothetical protein